MAGILGKKIGMTQIFSADGEIIPVTVIASGPCSVLQIKTKESCGYDAIQLGFEEKKDIKLTKPLREKFKRIKITPKRLIREIRITDPQNYQVGQNLDVTQFNSGDLVNIVGTSIGRGFQGGVKRWHWKGGPKTHGSMSHRAPGSIGSTSSLGKVLKGHHLPGHMGNQRVTVQNLEVIKVDKDNQLLVVRGSVPGHKNCYLVILKSKRKNKQPIVSLKKEAAAKPEKKEKKAKPAEGKK